MPSIPLQYGLSTLPFFKKNIRDQSTTTPLLSRSNQQIRFIITLTFLKISAVIHLNKKLYNIKYLMFIRASRRFNLHCISDFNCESIETARVCKCVIQPKTGSLTFFLHPRNPSYIFIFFKYTIKTFSSVSPLGISVSAQYFMIH